MLHEEVVKPTIEELLAALPPSSLDGGEVNRGLECALCKRRFTNRSARYLHEKKTHPGMQQSHVWLSLRTQFGITESHPLTRYKFACPLEACHSKTFASAKLLVQHYQKTHTEKRHRCALCPARFSLCRDLNYHVKKVCPARRTHTNANKDADKSSTVANKTSSATQIKASAAVNAEMRYRPIQPRQY